MKVRSWYGMTGEIEVENELWHLVKIGNIALHHPPLVNLMLRRGLPRNDRLRLSYLHEFGHFQTLPLTLVHMLIVVWAARTKRHSLRGWLGWLAGLAVAHEGVWEMLSEGYVLAQDPAAYRLVYHSSPNFMLPLFWIKMSSLVAGLSWYLIKRSSQPTSKYEFVE